MIVMPSLLRFVIQMLPGRSVISDPHLGQTRFGGEVLSREGNQQLLSREGNQQLLSREGNQQLLSREGNQQLLSRVRVGELALCLVAMPGPRAECVATSLRDHRALRLLALGASRFGSGTNLIACSALNMLHIFRLHADALESLTIAMPASPRPAEVAIAGPRIAALCATQLVLLDASTLPSRVRTQPLRTR